MKGGRRIVDAARNRGLKWLRRANAGGVSAAKSLRAHRRRWPAPLKLEARLAS